MAPLQGPPQYAWTWRCDICGKPIADRQGFVEFTDPTTHGYPQWDLDSERRAVAAERLWEAQHGREAVLASDIPDEYVRAEIVAYHKRCDPHPDLNPYWIEIERARDLKDVLDWVAHLTEKIWIGRREVAAFIRKFQFGQSAADGAR